MTSYEWIQLVNDIKDSLAATRSHFLGTKPSSLIEVDDAIRVAMEQFTREVLDDKGAE